MSAPNESTNNFLPKFLAIIIMTVAVLVMIGWLFDLTLLKSIIIGWVEMKFITALLFFVSGIILFFASLPPTNKNRNIVLFFCSAFILFCLIFLALIYVGVDTGIGTLFVAENKNAIKTVTPGYPSTGTMIAFLLVVIYGCMIASDKINIFKFRLISFIIIMIGEMAIFGYVINVPLLYYYIDKVSNAIAINTAFLLILIGVGFWSNLNYLKNKN